MVTKKSCACQMQNQNISILKKECFTAIAPEIWIMRKYCAGYIPVRRAKQRSDTPCTDFIPQPVRSILQGTSGSKSFAESKYQFSHSKCALDCRISIRVVLFPFFFFFELILKRSPSRWSLNSPHWISHN